MTHLPACFNFSYMLKTHSCPMYKAQTLLTHWCLISIGLVLLVDQQFRLFFIWKKNSMRKKLCPNIISPCFTAKPRPLVNEPQSCICMEGKTAMWRLAIDTQHLSAASFTLTRSGSAVTELKEPCTSVLLSTFGSWASPVINLDWGQCRLTI